MSVENIDIGDADESCDSESKFALGRLASLCNATAHVVQGIAYAPYREPTVDIVSYDSSKGCAEIPDPLMNAHKLSRFFLEGAGDCLYSISKLLGLEIPMVVSPAVLSRASSEYAARAFYLCEDGVDANQRVARMWKLQREGMVEKGWGGSRSGSMYELFQKSNEWANRSNFPKVPPIRDASKLIEKLSPEFGKKAYSVLSEFVHANSVTVSVATISAQESWHYNCEQSWNHGLFSVECAIRSGYAVAILRGCSLGDLGSCAEMFDEVVKLRPSSWDIPIDVPERPTPDYVV